MWIWPYVTHVEAARFWSLVLGLFGGILFFPAVGYNVRGEGGSWCVGLWNRGTTGLPVMSPRTLRSRMRRCWCLWPERHFRNTNGSYTVTWFSLAAFSILGVPASSGGPVSALHIFWPLLVGSHLLGSCRRLGPECRAQDRRATRGLVRPLSAWPHVSEALSYNTPRWPGWSLRFPSAQKCSECENSKSNEWDL